MGEPRLSDELPAADVAEYLRQHPQFLRRFPKLAAVLELPREHGEVASLASYQLDVLRRRNRELERKLAELVQVADRNEQLMMRVHAFTSSLLRADNAAVLMRSVAAGLTEDFGTDMVRLLVFRPVQDLPEADWFLVEPGGAAALPAFAEFLARDEPQVGRLPMAMLERLFGERAADIQSAAVVRLGEAGIMAIGSHDPNRFHPGMGGLFLQVIGEAVTTALARHCQDA